MDGIRTVKMQKIEKRVLEIPKEYEEKLSEQTGIESSLDENGMKEYLNEVIKEVQEHHLSNSTVESPAVF